MEAKICTNLSSQTSFLLLGASFLKPLLFLNWFKANEGGCPQWLTGWAQTRTLKGELLSMSIALTYPTMHHKKSVLLCSCLPCSNIDFRLIGARRWRGCQWLRTTGSTFSDVKNSGVSIFHLIKRHSDLCDGVITLSLTVLVLRGPHYFHTVPLWHIRKTMTAIIMFHIKKSNV